MTLQDLFLLIQQNGTTWLGIILVLSGFIEFSKIKLNPWTWVGHMIMKLFGFIGRLFNQEIYHTLESIDSRMKGNELKHMESTIELNQQLKELKEQLESLKLNQISTENRVDYSIAMSSRTRIIASADRIVNGEEISDEMIAQLGEDIEVYDDYCYRHPEYTNHKGQMSKKVVRHYEQDKLTAKYNENVTVANDRKE